MTADERLARIRVACTRLLSLLGAEDRNVLVQAEIAHAAAHVAENVQALDTHLTSGGAFPGEWVEACAVTPDAAEEVPSA